MSKPGEADALFHHLGVTMARLRFEAHRPLGERWRLWFFGPNDVFVVQVIDSQLTGHREWADAGPVVDEVEDQLSKRYSSVTRRQVPTGTGAVAEWEISP